MAKFSFVCANWLLGPLLARLALALALALALTLMLMLRLWLWLWLWPALVSLSILAGPCRQCCLSPRCPY